MYVFSLRLLATRCPLTGGGNFCVSNGGARAREETARLPRGHPNLARHAGYVCVWLGAQLGVCLGERSSNSRYPISKDSTVVQVRQYYILRDLNFTRLLGKHGKVFTRLVAHNCRTLSRFPPRHEATRSIATPLDEMLVHPLYSLSIRLFGGGEEERISSTLPPPLRKA